MENGNRKYCGGNRKIIVEGGTWQIVVEIEKNVVLYIHLILILLSFLFNTIYFKKNLILFGYKYFKKIKSNIHNLDGNFNFYISLNDVSIKKNKP